MRKRRRFLTLAVIIFLIFAVAIWWLNTVYLPTKVKAFVVKTLEQATNRKVHLEDIGYNIFKGIVLKNLTISERGQPTVGHLNEVEVVKARFLKVKEASFTVLLLPLLKKKVIIPVLRLSHPSISLCRKEEGDWNFSDILDRLKEQPRTKGKFSILISKLVVRDGGVSFEDRTTEPEFSSGLADLNGEVRFSLPSVIKFGVEATLVDRTTTFMARGRYNLSPQSLSLKLSSKDILLPDYACYYSELLPYEVSGGRSDLQLDLLLKDSIIQLSGSSSIDEIDLKRGDISSRGDLALDGKITYDLSDRESLKYEGVIMLDEIEVAGLPWIETISDMKGRVRFSQDLIYAEDLKCQTLGSPIITTLKLQDLKDPSLDLKLESDVELAKLKASLPPKLEPRAKDIEVGGRTFISLNLSGPLKDPSKLELSGQATLQGVEVKTPLLLEELSDIQGEVSFKRDSVASSKLSLAYKDVRYRLAGSLTNFARPDVKLTLRSKDLSVASDFGLRNGDIHISRAEGSYLKSSFNLKGTLRNYHDPTLDIHGSLRVDLLDLRRVLPDISAHLAKIALEGRCDLQGMLLGKWRKPKEWEVGLKATSPQISIKEYKFDRAFLDLRMRNGRLSVVKLIAYPYGGKLTSSFACNLARPEAPFAIDLEVVDLDLARLAEATPLIEKDIRGRLLGKLRLEGLSQDPKTFIGRGWVQIVEANLWEIKLLGKLGDLLYFTALPTARITQARGTFTVADQAIMTKDLELSGEEVTLLAEGSIGFDTSLNLYLTARVPEKLAAKLPDKVSTFFKRVVWGGLARYKIEGTLANPEYNRVPLPEILIDELLKGFLERLK